MLDITEKFQSLFSLDLYTVYYFQQNFKKEILINTGQVMADTGHEKPFFFFFLNIIFL